MDSVFLRYPAFRFDSAISAIMKKTESGDRNENSDY